MFCHPTNSAPPTLDKPLNSSALDSDLAKVRGPARRSVLGGLALAASLTAAPHIACVFGAVGALGGGYSLYSWCNHGRNEPAASPNLPRLSALPENYREFRAEVNAHAAQILVQSHPEFQSVIAFKQAESPGEVIQLTFLEDKDSGVVSAIVCKQGALCPCEGPQLFAVGHRDAVQSEGPGSYVGQRAILRTLYAGEAAHP
jgi:hypothetical protein